MNGTERPTPLLLIHGFPLDSRMWRGAIAWFDGLRPVYAPDLASLVGTSGAFTLEDLARNLIDYLPARKAVVVGLSMGGYIALEMWKVAPERFAGLVLADTKAEADTPEARAGRDAMIAAVPEEGVEEATADLRKKLTSTMAIPSVRQEVAQMVVEQHPVFVMACQAAMRDRPDNTAILETIDVPALVIVGQDDVITPPELSRRMAAHLPKSRLEIIPRAGHLAPMERSGPFNNTLERWLSEQGL